MEPRPDDLSSYVCGLAYVNRLHARLHASCLPHTADGIHLPCQVDPMLQMEVFRDPTVPCSLQWRTCP